MTDTATLHFYRQHRAHQFATYGGASTTYPGGRTETTGGGAPYGEHALSAFIAAKRSIAFRAYLSETVATHKRRSAAARRGWKTRRANAE